MNYEFDPSKDAINLDKHGVSLAVVVDFAWESAVVREDARKPYAEPRFQATGYIDERLHVLVFCMRADALRVISLRKANSREVKAYVSDH